MSNEISKSRRKFMMGAPALAATTLAAPMVLNATRVEAATISGTTIANSYWTEYEAKQWHRDTDYLYAFPNAFNSRTEIKRFRYNTTGGRYAHYDETLQVRHIRSGTVKGVFLLNASYNALGMSATSDLYFQAMPSNFNMSSLNTDHRRAHPSRLLNATVTPQHWNYGISDPSNLLYLANKEATLEKLNHNEFIMERWREKNGSKRSFIVLIDIVRIGNKHEPRYIIAKDTSNTAVSRFYAAKNAHIDAWTGGIWGGIEMFGGTVGLIGTYMGAVPSGGASLTAVGVSFASIGKGGTDIAAAVTKKHDEYERYNGLFETSIGASQYSGYLVRGDLSSTWQAAIDQAYA